MQAAYAAQGVVILGYIDDVHLLGPPGAAAAAFAALKAELLAIGLSLRAGKCHAFSPTGQYGTQRARHRHRAHRL